MGLSALVSGYHHIMTDLPLHLTIRFINGHFKLLPGLPSKYGLNFTAAHTYTTEGEITVFWTVECELTSDEVLLIVRMWLRVV
jgi:hypothetical protein